MPIDIDKPVVKRKRAAKRPTVTSDPRPNTSDGISGIPNPSMEENVTEFAKSNYNPDFEAFETLVDEIRKSVRKTVDYRKSVNDDSPTSLSHYTDEAIKKGLRASRWA